MMKNMTLENIAKACKGIFTGDEADKSKLIEGVYIDSRKIKGNDLFIATVGERVDGHSFIPQVFEKGAACVICEKAPENGLKPYILVEDSFQALKDIAAFYRAQLNIPIVGISGSVGKTSTKEAIAAVLSVKYKVQKTAGNFNNEVGMPLTLLTITDEHEAAVVEMGISDFGEMDRLAKIARPDICVITNIGLCHLENLGTQEGILKAKTEMFAHRNTEGDVILNGDDAHLVTIKDVAGTAPIYFGESEDCDVQIKEAKLLGLLGADFTLSTKQGDIVCHTGLPGYHAVTNAVCAAAVGISLGLRNEEIAEGIRLQQSVSGRSNLIKTDDYILIDDCYNANPVSMREAIDLLRLSDTRKVAVLGDMFELGENEEKLHYGVGEYIAEHPVDVVMCAGALSKNIYEGASKSGDSGILLKHFDTRDELMAALEGVLKKGDAVLVKASHGMHFEEIVEKLR